MRRIVSVLVAAMVWLPLLHWVVVADPREGLRAHVLQRWTSPPAAPEEMRAVNPEWDFMARTYSALALAMQGPAGLHAIDVILEDTLQGERLHGQAHYLLPYAHARAFVHPEGRSVFVDGEILLMITAREELARAAGQPPRYLEEAERRAQAITVSMQASPTLSAESYPDECWTFCNTTALAALQRYDRLRAHAEHAELTQRWLAHARAHLVDPSNGLLISSYTRDGRILQGAEGSSLWMTIHNLTDLDPEFSRAQYTIAQRELAQRVLGFGWSREWPRSAPREGAQVDVDSGGVVPVLEASAGASGMAFLAAAAQGDRGTLDALTASLSLGAIPRADHGGFYASNEVGDAVILYSLELAQRQEVR